jgi:hypothetical protein
MNGSQAFLIGRNEMEQTMSYQIKPSKFCIEIMEGISYQQAIQEIIFSNEADTKHDLQFRSTHLTASLVLEDNHEFNPGNAVRVEIYGATVGYLSKGDAQQYRAILRSSGIPNAICTCKARAISRREGGDLLFRIWLHIDLHRPLEMDITQVRPRRKIFGLF